MKKIGFVDYYISEWHANNYPKWIAEACEKNGLEYEVAYAWAELDVSFYDGRSTDEWCRDFGVQRCDSIAQLCQLSDVIIVLAPSDPDKHLDYVSEVFRYGKRTYVDKTFAPDFATAQEMFDIAWRYGTPFFSTSALRYATELDELEGADEVYTTGGGSNLSEYIVHQVEMLVKLLGSVHSVRAEAVGERTDFYLEFNNGSTATMSYAPDLPYTVRDAYTECGGDITSPYFDALIRDILRFFESGVVSFDTASTLEVMKVREAAIMASQVPGEVIYLDYI